MSEENVLKLEINSITDFQKELHYSKDPKDNQDQVNSRFICTLDKYAWCAHTKVKMRPRSEHNEEGEEVIYTASKKFDVLFKSEVHINLLPIKVNDKFKSRIEICYPHNPGHNICYSGELKVDDDHHQTIDSIWLDIYSQFYMKSGTGMREHYDRMIGNIPCLTEWNTELPGVKLIVPQPFYYSRNTRVGLRTLRSSMNTVTHHYKIRNKITDILRMRVRVKTDEESEDEPMWKEIPCNLKYLDIIGNRKTLPVPELWGRYSLMTDEEREWHKSFSSVDPTRANFNGKIRPNVIYTEDIVVASSDNPTSLGSTDVIPLHCKSPCKALFWVAQNIEAIENRNFSNYTTNPDDLYGGWNPCANIDLKYGGTPKIRKWSHEHFDLSECWDFFPSAPSEPGYNAMSYSYDPKSLNADTAIVLESLNASLHVKLGNTDPFKSIETPEEGEYDEDGEIIPIEALPNSNVSVSNKDKYIIHVRALVYKKLEINWNGKDERLEYLLKEEAIKN